MAVLVIAFGVLILMIGLLGAVQPQAFIRLIGRLQAQRRLVPIAVVMRLIMGVALLLAASDSRFPRTLWVLGVIALVAAVTILVLGEDRMWRMVKWFTEAPPNLARFGLLCAAAFGAFLIWAVW